MPSTTYIKADVEQWAPNAIWLGSPQQAYRQGCVIKQAVPMLAGEAAIVMGEGEGSIYSYPFNTANGYGSTNTATARFTNVVANQGTDITYVDSATLGASFTINASGVYAISATQAFAAAGDVCISKNATTLTSTPSVLTEILSESTSSSAAFRATAACTAYLNSGDVIRVQCAGSPSGNRQFFTITRVA